MQHGDVFVGDTSGYNHITGHYIANILVIFQQPGNITGYNQRVIYYLGFSILRVIFHIMII